MRKPLATILFCFLMGCNPGGEGADAGQSGAGPGWEVNYSGDISGTQGGRIVTAAPTPGDLGFSISGAATDGEDLMSVSLSFITRANDEGELVPGDYGLGLIRLELAGDVACSIPGEDASATILDNNEETFSVEFSGAVDCDGNNISFDGFAKNG